MPSTPEEIAEITDAILAGPKSAQVADRSAVAHDPLAALEVEKYRAAQAAAARTGGIGVRLFNTKPPGCV